VHRWLAYSFQYLPEDPVAGPRRGWNLADPSERRSLKKSLRLALAVQISSQILVSIHSGVVGPLITLKVPQRSGCTFCPLPATTGVCGV
jgi:hypothetical protein